MNISAVSNIKEKDKARERFNLACKEYLAKGNKITQEPFGKSGHPPESKRKRVGITITKKKEAPC